MVCMLTTSDFETAALGLPNPSPSPPKRNKNYSPAWDIRLTLHGLQGHQCQERIRALKVLPTHGAKR